MSHLVSARDEPWVEGSVRSRGLCREDGTVSLLRTQLSQSMSKGSVKNGILVYDGMVTMWRSDAYCIVYTSSLPYNQYNIADVALNNKNSLAVT